MSDNIRNILLRALFEPDFHNKLLTDGEEALSGYNLTDEERRAVLAPSPELYGLIAPRTAREGMLSGRLFVEPPTITTTTTTIVAVIIAVAIVVFVTAIAASNPQTTDLEALRPLINAIKSSQGA